MNRRDSDEDYLDQLYSRSAKAQPPAHLDQKILAQARANSPVNRFSAAFKWQRILSVAAVMVLSMYIFFDVDGERLSDAGAPAFLPQSSNLSSPAVISEEPRLLMREKSERVRQEKKKALRKSAAKEAPYYAADEMAEREEAVQGQMQHEAVAPSALSSQALSLEKRAADVEESPDVMIKEIQRLLDDGRIEDAKMLYKRLKQAFPEYPVPVLILNSMENAAEVEQ